LRLAALCDVAAAARELGLRLGGAVASPLPGPSGNVEFFLFLRRDGGDVGDAALAAAVEVGPS
jgi:23S rRNA (cytidine1920-2'-O)/16S rRNA (cytidine1409-2'-O)-methyltransferase